MFTVKSPVLLIMRKKIECERSESGIFCKVGKN